MREKQHYRRVFSYPTKVFCFSMGGFKTRPYFAFRRKQKTENHLGAVRQFLISPGFLL